MYRIRLASGEEAAYKTIEELALAVQSGLLGGGASIFHSKTDRWLPVDQHPHLKGVVAPHHAHAHSSGQRRALADKPKTTSEHIPAPNRARLARPPSRPARFQPHRRSSANRLVYASALGLVLLVGWRVSSRGTPLLSTAQSAAMDPPPKPRGPHGRVAAVPTPSGQGSLDSISPSPEATPPVQPEAPLTPESLVVRYRAAYAAAQLDMANGMASIGFESFFALGRFGTADSLRASRRLLASAANVVRVYRSRELLIEHSYEDSVRYLAGTTGWSAPELRVWERRTPYKESYETAQLTDSLISEADSLFGLLAGALGRYHLRAGVITFDDPKVGRTYADRRAWLVQHTRSWANMPRIPPPTLEQVLRAFGTIPPPRMGSEE